MSVINCCRRIIVSVYSIAFTAQKTSCGRSEQKLFVRWIRYYSIFKFIFRRSLTLINRLWKLNKTLEFETDSSLVRELFDYIDVRLWIMFLKFQIYNITFIDWSNFLICFYSSKLWILYILYTCFLQCKNKDFKIMLLQVLSHI